MSGRSDFNSRQRQLNEDLKAGRFRSVYLLCGEQSYLRHSNKERLKKALLGDGDEMNLSRFTGQELTAAEVYEQAQTLPFFADRRVILVEDSGWFDRKAGAESDAFAEYVGKIPDTTSVVFVEETADKRKKLYKAVGAAGTIFECDTPDETSLRNWARSLFEREGIEIEGPALALFLDRTGEDMENIASEAEKLICYSLDREKPVTIRRGDILKACSPRVKDRIFDMIGEASSHNLKGALAIYMDLLALQTRPQVILTLMARQYLQLIQVKEMMPDKGDREIASALRLPYFVIAKRYKPALRGYREGELLEALDDCLEADRLSKSGKMDAGAAVEMLLVRRAGRTAV